MMMMVNMILSSFHLVYLIKKGLPFPISLRSIFFFTHQSPPTDSAGKNDGDDE
jgi:hypothetical protein